MLYALISLPAFLCLCLLLRQTPYTADSYGRKASLYDPSGRILEAIDLQEYTSVGVGQFKNIQVDLSPFGDVTDGFYIELTPHSHMFCLHGDAQIKRGNRLYKGGELHDGDTIFLRGGATLIFTHD